MHYDEAPRRLSRGAIAALFAAGGLHFLGTFPTGELLLAVVASVLAAASILAHSLRRERAGRKFTSLPLYQVLHRREIDPARRERLAREWPIFDRGESAYAPYVAKLFKRHTYRFPEGATDAERSFRERLMAGDGLVEPLAALREEDLRLDENLFVHFLDCYVDDFDRQLKNLSTTDSGAPASIYDRVEAKLKERQAQMVPGETRKKTARARDDLQEAATIDEIKAEFGDHALEDPVIRRILKQNGFRLD